MLVLRVVACQAAGMDSKQLGVRIRQARVAKRPKMSQAALAQALQVDLKTIYNWEHGKNDGAWDQIPAIERVLGGVMEAAAGESAPSFELLEKALRAADASVAEAREIVRRMAERQGNQ